MKLGYVQRKLLLLMLGGLSIGLSGNPRRAFYILKKIQWEWGNINREKKITEGNLKQSIKRLYDSKLITVRKKTDGTTEIVLTEKGREVAIEIDATKIKPKKLKNWDKKWRVIIFDIPENRRAKRDAFRKKIKELGFLELQKSVWVSPIDYKKEIRYLIKAFQGGRYINFMIVEFIEDEKYLKKHFKI